MVDERKGRLVRPRTLGIVGAAACVMVACGVWWASSRGAKRDRLSTDDARPVAIAGAMESRIVAFCSDCHALPRAENFPRDRWQEEVRRGYAFYARSGRSDLDPPPMHLTIAYFHSRAPEEMVFPQPEEAKTALRTSFAAEKLTLTLDTNVLPEISHMRWTRLDADRGPVLLVCDMRYGYVAAVDLREPSPRPRVLARLQNPAHVEPCDLDGDGAIDLVVADLGSSRPDDHDRGRVVWLRRQPAAESYEEIVLAAGLCRVADVRPADFDADGDLDLVVAEFGHIRTGRILWLENVAAARERPRFELHELDPRAGAIHVPVCDLNGDGRLDFAALVSQDYECVEAFTNLGQGRFQRDTLWQAPDLTFGSSGIEVVDLDQDGDPDILYTNGDAWDNWYASPAHGVQWLEQRGPLEFAHHRITDLVGAYRALAADFDLDGDLDIMTVTWLPPQLMPAALREKPLTSILFLEQTSRGKFVRHTLERGSPVYAAMEVADFDNDGDSDFAVCSGPHVASGKEHAHWLAVWRNQKITASK